MRRMRAVVNSNSFKYHLNLFFPARCSINNITRIIWVCCAAGVYSAYPIALRGDYAGRAPVAAAFHEKQHTYA